MKIGELSQLTGVSIPTIRYYVSLGLLVPVRDSYQYQFRVEDYQVLTNIVRLKNWGFRLDEIHHILSIKRFAVGVEPDEREEYLHLLERRCNDLERDCAVIQGQIEELRIEIEKERSRNFERRQTGFPLRAIPLLCCPHCRSELQMGNVSMNSQFIFEGSLYCQCGYHAQIRNGILYACSEHADEQDKADTERSIYRECPNELVSIVHKSYNWMRRRMQKLEFTGNEVIMETQLNSFFYLYNNLDLLVPGNLCIVQDKFPEIVELYKNYIDQMNLDLNILYIALGSSGLPIKQESVDLLIDYNSTNEYGIFSHRYYLSEMHQYLKPGASVIGTYFYFEPHSCSVQNLIRSYPANHPKNYTFDYFKKQIMDGGYKLIEQEEIDISYDSGCGLTFIFHKTGEKMFVSSFVLQKQ